MLAVACLVGPDGEHAADDRTAREWAEIAAIHAVRGIVHEEEFVVGDAAAALPDRQFAAGIVARARAAVGGAIGKNVEAVATDGLTRKRKDALQQRHAIRQIAAVSEEFRDQRWRHDRDKIGDSKIVGRLHGVEADRCAGAGVPDQRLRRVNESRRAEREAGKCCR